jgi:demethylmenaquinone methyltransferase/2-methoxy-6-polyprenyl-1,4-benzoquinol methylase
MFAEIAPRYDFLNHLLSLNIDRYWRSRTLDLLDPKPGDPFLDVCTGTGDLALAVAKRLDRKTQVIGSDFCGEMLHFARQKQHKMQQKPQQQKQPQKQQQQKQRKMQQQQKRH